MKKLITLLSILTLGTSSISFAETTKNIEEKKEEIKIVKLEEKKEKTPEEIQWEKAHAYAHYRSETR
ncbi:hypothetical protein [uncultured Fusobacterium sp.]|uniref:hypothetical protein n=1 Tax=uncultured Fusobacterium sp. TaxID=159267 RepID=UPI0025DC93B2|nr:hypothetical protein [uncultured Fusobacterium sp.]